MSCYLLMEDSSKSSSSSSSYIFHVYSFSCESMSVNPCLVREVWSLLLEKLYFFIRLYACKCHTIHWYRSPKGEQVTRWGVSIILEVHLAFESMWYKSWGFKVIRSYLYWLQISWNSWQVSLRPIDKISNTTIGSWSNIIVIDQ